MNCLLSSLTLHGLSLFQLSGMLPLASSGLSLNFGKKNNSKEAISVLLLVQTMDSSTLPWASSLVVELGFPVLLLVTLPKSFLDSMMNMTPRRRAPLMAQEIPMVHQSYMIFPSTLSPSPTTLLYHQSFGSVELSLASSGCSLPMISIAIYQQLKSLDILTF